MHFKTNGYITLEELQEELAEIFQMIERGGNKPFIRNMDVFIRLEDEKGRAFDIHGKNECIMRFSSDRFADDVLAGLKAKKKQVDISNELGISSQRVSKIKKYLIKNGLL
jgi:hypothetical protein